MNQPDILYSSLLLLVALISTAVAGIVWQRRTAPGAGALVIYMIAIAWWSATYAMFWADMYPSRSFWLNATYFGAVTVSPAMLVFTLQFTHRARWLTRPLLALLSAIATLTVVLLWTDPWHHLFFGGQRNLTDSTIYSGGPWFWAFIVYSYVLSLIVIWLLISSLSGARAVYRHQIELVLLATIIPWIANFASLVNLSPLPALDLTPFAFFLTGVIISVGLFRYHLFDIAPIARDKLIENMRDSILVVDRQNRVIDVNPALIELLTTRAMPLIGQNVVELFPHWEQLKAIFEEEEPAGQEIQMPDLPFRYFNVRLIRLQDRRGNEQGTLMILQDITARKQLEAEREALIHTLQTTLGQVKTLSGLLPICASCKKIRDDQGYWQDVAVYVRDHSEAEFTHGMCPDCMDKFYPEFTKKTRQP